MARGDHHDMGSSKAPEGAAPGEAPQRVSGSGAQLDLEDLAIDRNGEIPIGVQLAWGLRARIGDGRLAPGRRLPGLRELAEMLGINANTARAVYQRLEQEGLIDSRQGTGTFVAHVAQERSAVGQIAAAAARQAHQTGVDPREVAAALYVTVEPSDHAAILAGERRRELRDQISALEQALSELQARHPGLIPPPSKPLRHAGPRLLSVEELERVRSGLLRRLAAAEPEAQAETKRTVGTQVRGGARNTPSAQAAKPTKKAPEKTARPHPRTRPSTA